MRSRLPAPRGRRRRGDRCLRHDHVGLGLEEVPHLQAPVSLPMLAEAMLERRYGDALPAPVHLVPGVRSGRELELSRLHARRGDGDRRSARPRRDQPPFLYISTGSHSKFVGVDRDGQIDWSLVDAQRRNPPRAPPRTILAGDRPRRRGRPRDARGGRSLRRAPPALTRALFAARRSARVRGMSRPAFRFLPARSPARTCLRRAAEARGGLPDRVAIGGTGSLRERIGTCSSGNLVWRSSGASTFPWAPSAPGTCSQASGRPPMRELPKKELTCAGSSTRQRGRMRRCSRDLVAAPALQPELHR